LRRFIILLSALVLLYFAFYLRWRNARLVESTQAGPEDHSSYIYVSFCDLNTPDDFWTIPAFSIDSLLTGVSIICE